MPMPSVAKAMQDVRLLLVFDTMVEVSTDFWVSALVELHQHDEAFTSADYELLLGGANTLAERYMDAVVSDAQTYAHAAVQLARGWRFIYFVQLWMPGPNRAQRN